MHSAVLNEGRNCRMKSGIIGRAAGERRLTAELSVVGTDQAIGRMLIRARERFRGSLDAFKAPSLPYHSVVWKILRTDTVKRAAAVYDHHIIA
jgi:hypothetical protein